MPPYSSLGFVFLIAATTKAQNTTSPYPKATASMVGWQDNPNGRGTLSLLYSCLITILACTWTVLHLNVPAIQDGEWRRALRKAKWMAITILFPEFILSKSICELRLALSDLRDFDEELARRHGSLQWTVRSDRGGVERTWSWEIDYGPWAGFLFRFLRLPPPLTASDRERLKQIEPESPSDISILEWMPSDLNTPSGYHDSSDTPPSPNSRASSRGGREAIYDLMGPPPGFHAPGSALTALPEDNQERKPQEQDLQQQELQPRGVREMEHQEAIPRKESSMESPLNVAVSPSPLTHQGSREQLHYHSTQRWTPTHSYFANMGSLVYTDRSNLNPRSEDQEFCALTGAKLSGRYYWVSEHPLKGLLLERSDIEDKSKADWLLKAIAVAQIVWVILTSLVRRIAGLPITQLEIATVAFSIFAIATYLTNWWKPKDVAQPVKLQVLAIGGTTYVDGITQKPRGYDRTQDFMVRLTAPARAQKHALSIRDLTRVKNDRVWMEGDVPLIYSIMAASALVFGGLHCLAWTFEFPTQAELVLWRVASVVSTILPGVSLATSLALNYLVTTHADNSLVCSLLERLDPLNKFPEEFWELFEAKTAFESWGWDLDQIVAFISHAPAARNWEEAPTAAQISQLKQDRSTWRKSALLLNRLRFYDSDLSMFVKRWMEAKGGRRDKFLVGEWANFLVQTPRKKYPDEVRELRRDFEKFLRTKLNESGLTVPDLNCAEFIETVAVHFALGRATQALWQRNCHRASQFATISSGIVYAASRLIILALLFTCLRDVPRAVYEDIPWTRYLPNIS